jgi:hypothetical protein
VDGAKGGRGRRRRAQGSGEEGVKEAEEDGGMQMEGRNRSRVERGEGQKINPGRQQNKSNQCQTHRPSLKEK